MISMVFNVTNLCILIVVLMILYGFLKPYFKGKTIEAVVDGYCHPEWEKDSDIMWVYRFMYREQKAGKRLYCHSRRHFDSKEAMRKYPKGSTVKIRYYDDERAGKLALIEGDAADKKQQMMYIALTIIGGIVLAVGLQMLNYTMN